MHVNIKAGTSMTTIVQGSNKNVCLCFHTIDPNVLLYRYLLAQGESLQIIFHEDLQGHKYCLGMPYFL